MRKKTLVPSVSDHLGLTCCASPEGEPDVGAALEPQGLGDDDVRGAIHEEAFAGLTAFNGRRR